MSDINEPRRGPGRPPNVERQAMRPETPDARPSLRERLRGKTREYVTNQNRLDIPKEILDEFPDVSFEFKRHTCKGEEDPSYLRYMRQQGWEPVMYEDVPKMAPSGETGSVLIDGQLLMARPLALTQRAQSEVKRLADQQIADRNKFMGVAPAGHAPRLSPDQFGNYKGNPGGIQEQAMRPIPVEE